MPGDVVIQTERLMLREFLPEDVNALTVILGDAEMMTYYPHPLSREESAAWIERWRTLYRERGFGLWAMDLRETGELVGDCGLTAPTVDGVPEVEIGWHVKRDLWNRGLATEAARAVRDYGLRTLGLDRLISLVRPVNLASRRVAEKIGMSLDKQTIYGSMGWLHLVYATSTRGNHDQALSLDADDDGR